MTDSDSAAAAGAIRRHALALGFDRVGYCRAVVPAEGSHFERWLASGMHGGMEWLRRGRDRRLDPCRVLSSARSLILVARSYATPQAASAPPSGTGPHGTIARYARGDDYHVVMGKRLLDLEEFVERVAPGQRALAYVDTGPFLERMWAAQAGIGWIGKNAMVLNKEMGSYFFIGLVVTTLPLPADEPATDQCGACTLCIDACPTDAIVEPRMVDSRLCIAYQTIELRGPIPPEHRGGIGTRIFGCDDCQEACPWNAAPSGDGGDWFPPRPGSLSPSLEEILTMSHEEYLERFRGSSVKRATYNGLRRNAAVALGNAAAGAAFSKKADGGEADALRRVASDAREDPVVREHADWATRSR